MSHCLSCADGKNCLLLSHLGWHVPSCDQEDTREYLPWELFYTQGRNNAVFLTESMFLHGIPETSVAVL